MSRTTYMVAIVDVLALTASAPAETLFVPAGFATIQAAVDAAAEGDEIVVAPGAYHETIEIYTSLTLRGEAGSAATTIDADGLGTAVHSWFGHLTIEGFTVTGGFASSGAGVRSYEGLSIANCRFVENQALGYGGAVFAEIGALEVDSCTFESNDAVDGGAIAIFGACAQPILANCRFLDNSASRGGGAVWLFQVSQPITVNCTFDGNTAPRGGAIQIDWSDGPRIVNCTFTANASANTVWLRGAIGGWMVAEMVNCILWENDASQEIFEDMFAAAAVTHCDVQGGWPGAGNIDRDPQFVDSLGPDGIPATLDDDLRLRAGSLGLDAGDRFALPRDITDLDGDGDCDEPIPFDLDGASRVVAFGDDAAGVVDMGAYERAIGHDSRRHMTTDDADPFGVGHGHLSTEYK